MSAERLDGKRVEAAANTEVERRAAETEATPVARPPPWPFHEWWSQDDSRGGHPCETAPCTNGACVAACVEPACVTTTCRCRVGWEGAPDACAKEPVAAKGALPTACASPQIGMGTSFFPQDGMDLRAHRNGAPGWEDEMASLTRDAVRVALENGVRFFDLSATYANVDDSLAALSGAIDAGDVPRSALCVCLKVRPEDAPGAAARALASKHAFAFDVVLAYHAVPHFEASWREYEALVDDGTTRSLGLSNFYRESDATKVFDIATYRPALTQFELHPYQQHAPLAAFYERHGIRVVAHSPLGAPNKVRFLATAEEDPTTVHKYSVLDNPRVKEIAGRLGASPAAVVLRWHLDHGRIPIPKSYDPAHLAENAAAAAIPPLGPAPTTALDALHLAEDISVVRFFHKANKLARRRRSPPTRQSRPNARA